MDHRIGRCVRETGETQVSVSWDLDGNGTAKVNTGIGFLDHMLDLVAHHGIFDLDIEVKGDLHVDAHHSVEDCALAMGIALRNALGERRGVTRMGQAVVPMDEALALVAVDLSGRAYAALDIPLRTQMLGSMPSEMIPHFFESLAMEARCNLHARVLAGSNDHHIVEAIFKGLARALRAASRIDPERAGQVPSTKGVL